jgi:hypothetical protein
MFRDLVVRGGVEPPTFRFSVRLWDSCGEPPAPRTCGDSVGLPRAPRLPHDPARNLEHTRDELT